MSHIGILSAHFYSHLQCLSAVGRALRERGHRVTVFNLQDVRERVLAGGLEFWAVGGSSMLPGTLSKLEAGMADPQARIDIRALIEIMRTVNAAIFKEGPDAITAAGVDALLVDQDCPVGGTIADVLALPYVTMCAAAPAHREGTIPPASSPWTYSTSLWAQLRNQMASAIFEWVSRPLSGDLNRWRRQAHLPEYRIFEDSFSGLAQITQLPAAYDFPRTTLPAHFHYVGPFLAKPTRLIPFPWERLDGRPLIYASMGTVQNRDTTTFRTIAAACDGLDAQLVLSLGGGGNVDDYRDLPGGTIVVAFAPQLELLARARMAISHAGLNTVLECLSCGVPSVVIPVADDQPGLAARLAWHGAGRVVSFPQLNVPRLREAVVQVLREDSYQQRTARLQAAVRETGGVKQAADIVEAAIATRRPVLREGLAVARSGK